MTLNMKITENGKVKMSVGPDRVRKDDLKKWLGRNSDAILVKLEGGRNDSFACSPGHVCRIEVDDDGQKYNVFVGGHMLGQLPDEALAFAERIDSSPEFMISIVGKVEHGASADLDEIYVYIAE